MTDTERAETGDRALERARALFARAMEGQLDLACLLISVDRLARYRDPALREALRSAVEGVVRSDPEGGTWRVLRSGDELLVLCPRLALSDTGPAARALVEGVRRLSVRRKERNLRPRVSIGVAHNRNRPELDFETLLGVARESLGVAQAAGGDRWVHTELYELLTRRNHATGGATEAASPHFEELAAGVEPPAPAPATAAPVQGGVAGASGSADPVSPASAPEAAPLVDLLERRIAKLNKALERADAEIQHLKRALGGSPGVSSIYRSVQGLSPDEPLLDLKRRLMREIFDANQALRKAAS